MTRSTLLFPSVFDLHDFKKQTNLTNSEAVVNRLTAYFSPEELELAIANFKAELVKELTVTPVFY